MNKVMQSLLIVVALCLRVCNARTLPEIQDSRQEITLTQVIRAYPRSLKDLKFLSDLRENVEYDFWLDPRTIGEPVDIMAEGDSLKQLKLKLTNNNIIYRIFMKDVVISVQNHLAQNHNLPRAIGNEGENFWSYYRTYDEIVQWMKNLEALHPFQINLIQAGRSYNKRPIYVVKLVKNKLDIDLFKPAIWIDGGMHGREWISPAVVTYMLNELLKNPLYAPLLDEMDFYFMPVLNPDGYAYTFNEDQRLWRKTRSQSNSKLLNCIGVDPNRNWDFHWNGTLVKSQCSDKYPGLQPFSEKETEAMRNQILSKFFNLKAYLTYHSYAQLWMFPWGYTSAKVEDFSELESIGRAAVDATYSYKETRYKQQPLCIEEELCIQGNSVDWMKGVAKIKYSFLIQLPDLGNYGYLLPPSEIIPTGEESMLGLQVVANAVAQDNSNR